MGASRFPNKVMAEIAGAPMAQIASAAGPLDRAEAFQITVVPFAFFCQAVIATDRRGVSPPTEQVDQLGTATRGAEETPD